MVVGVSSRFARSTTEGGDTGSTTEGGDARSTTEGGDGHSMTGEEVDVVAVMKEVYAPPVAKGTPFIVTDLATAELVKVSANAFLATKISFINAMAEIAEVVGADVTQLADAIGYDARIGRKFLG